MNDAPLESTVVMDATAMSDYVHVLAREILEDGDAIEDIVFLGILRRGVPLAERIAARLGELTGTTPPVGALATTLYRDDARTAGADDKGYTHFDFEVDGKTVILVDDVLAAGRTIRAAMDEVMDYGRPRHIRLACMIDRGGRELPIQPDYLAWSLATDPNEWVAVRMTELDGEDAVYLERYPAEDESE